MAKVKTKDIRDLLRAEMRDGRFRMVDVDPDSTPGLKKRKDARKEMAAAHGRLFDLQERLFAENKRSVLVVPAGHGHGGQGRDHHACNGRPQPAGRAHHLVQAADA